MDSTIFHNYVCGVTHLPCCGCSLFCQHRQAKQGYQPVGLYDKQGKLIKPDNPPRIEKRKEAFEFFDTQFERKGFKHIRDKIYQHGCGQLINMR